MLKVFLNIMQTFTKSMLDSLIKFIWLALPLGFHIFFVQMREKIDTLPALPIYVPPDSTWMAIYDGVVIVNTNPGAVRARLKQWYAKFLRLVPLWITIAVIAALSLLVYIAIVIKG